MKKIAFILMPLLVLGCDLGFPRMYVNYDNLPEGEIKEHIIQTFPNPVENEEVYKLIHPHLNGHDSAAGIRNAALKIGMICQAEKSICEYSGYIRTRVTGLSSGSGRAKHIYQITISPDLGMDSLKINEQILEDTEKGN